MKKLVFYTPRPIAILVVMMTLAMPSMLFASNKSPLCFTARNGSVTVKFSIRTIAPVMQYSTDGVNWDTYTTGTKVTINANQSIYFRAKNNQKNAGAFAYLGPEGVVSSCFYFDSNNGGTIEGSGNIMSLYGPDCPDLPLNRYAFYGLFLHCKLLTTAPELPATKLNYRCYYSMFAHCTLLTKAPELLATEMEEECYKFMFSNCSSLQTAPTLPATKLAEKCYSYMFYNCSSLTKAPELPATEMEESCYRDMFYNCTSLAKAPALPATILDDWCYQNMFRKCSSLTTPPVLPAKTLNKGCYNCMFAHCTSLVTPPALPATELARICYFGMFYGCTSLTSVPDLPATTLEPECYGEMFYGCSSLKVNTAAPGKEWIIRIDAKSPNSLKKMFKKSGGTMNGTPKADVTYYIFSDPKVQK